MELCTFCGEQAIVRCVWLKLDRTNCLSWMCAKCLEDCEGEGVCKMHPQSTWFMNEVRESKRERH